MLPVLQVGPLSIQSYPLAVMLAFWATLAVGAWAAKQRGLDGDHVYNMGLYGLVGGVIVARIGHVIAFWPAYRTQPLEMIGLNTRAFLLWPGVIAALIVAGWYVYRHRLSPAAILDALAPGVLVGLAIAALGALLGGTALGAPADAPFAITLWGVRRHPSQVYEALAGLAVALVVLRTLRASRAPGTAAWVAVLGYGLSRWLLEPFRAGSATVLGGMRTPQLLGLAAALVALWALGSRFGRPEPLPGNQIQSPAE